MINIGCLYLFYNNGQYTYLIESFNFEYELVEVEEVVVDELLDFAHIEFHSIAVAGD